MPEMRIRPRHCDTLATAPRRRVRRATATVGALAGAAVLAACGSSGGSSNSGSSSGGSTSASSGAASSGGKGTVMVGKVNGYGSVLVTAADQPIYILSTDPSGSSKCSGSCAKTWKPVTVSGSPKAGSGASSSLLSSFKRSDGTTQVLYDKRALYTHAGSAASAAGTASDGGVWYLINAKGKVVKSTTSGGY
jgi:predicted lipoprotein with Yx(FWY)xxD motif